MRVLPFMAKQFFAQTERTHATRALNAHRPEARWTTTVTPILTELSTTSYGAAKAWLLLEPAPEPPPATAS